MFVTGGPGKPINLGEKMHEAVEDTESPKKVRAGFAYATESGISSLCEDDSGEDWRNEVQSEWIIGIDQGITEPDALRNLADYSDAQVRVLVPGGELNRRALYRRPRFHAKVVFLQSQVEDSAFLVTSSANMTASALEDIPTNYEVGTVQSMDSGLTNSDIDEFNEWWEHAWNQSMELSDEFLTKYKNIRNDWFDDNPEIQEFESSESVNHVSEADCFYIETRAMTGGSRNQIELSEELSPFIEEEGGEITIIYEGTTHTGRPVNPRITDPPFGMNITTVYLPTGPDYTNSYIHLEKLSYDPGEEPRYELTVADPSDDLVDEWKEEASTNGVSGQTGGGREFGFY
jgi:HKD family nuclease